MITRYEVAVQKIEKLELLLKESRERTEFWRLEALELEKELTETEHQLFLKTDFNPEHIDY